MTLGNQWGDCETGGYRNDQWYAGGFLTRTRPGLDAFLRRLGRPGGRPLSQNPTILAWQLMNEAEVKPVADSAAAARTPLAY